MRSELFGLVGVSVLAILASAGCSSSSSGAGGGGSGNAGNTGGASGLGGNTGTTSNCSNVSPCGGDIVGAWNVDASCLTLSGNMDVYSVGMGCRTVPVTGTLQVTGTWTAKADGTYADNTTTKGSISFPLDASCMSVSSVPTTCDRIQSIFSALGWTATCADKAGGGCSCTATANQSGGIGSITANAAQEGGYGTTGTTLTTDDTAPLDPNSPTALKYTYCVSGSTFTLSPQNSSVFPIAGTVTLQRNGTSGTGGATGAGGAGAGGSAAGGAPSTGGAAAGGAPSTGGAAAGGAPSTGGAAAGGKSGTGGAFTGGVTGVGGAATGGHTGTSATGGMGPTGGSSTNGGSSANGGASATGGTTTLGSGAPGPCDIYALASNTCVAAHSTVRALFSAYSGVLYQVKRASDSKTQDIGTLAPGGFADTTTQDTFCTGTTCTITKVYDQSGHGNFVEAETADSSVGGNAAQSAASATTEPFTVSGHKVYSLYMKTSQAYWRDGSKSGMPTGSAPQGIYMVTSGKHFGSGCCFDYGNGETSRTYVAGPSMDALNFSSCTIWGTGAGAGPWVMADLEGGLFAQGGSGKNANDASLTYTYVTALEKNNGTSEFALKGGDATTGSLSTFYKGSLPAGYNPMKKQGSIVLGSGGDCCYSNNTLSQGTFYEGAIVSGYPTDATDNAIQANIVATQYGK